MIKVETLSRSAEALLPPHECGGFHHESAGFPVLTQTRKPVPFTTMTFSAACIGGFRARRNRPTGCMRRGTCRQTFSGGNQRTGRSRFRFRYLALASAVGRGPAARPGSRPNPAKRAAPTGRLLPSDRRSAVPRPDPAKVGRRSTSEHSPRWLLFKSRRAASRHVRLGLLAAGS